MNLIRKVRISSDLILHALNEGTAACKAIKGIPGDAVLFNVLFDANARLSRTRFVVEFMG
jgi:hypothetical protein